jgi:hypothetical protein
MTSCDKATNGQVTGHDMSPRKWTAICPQCQLLLSALVMNRESFGGNVIFNEGESTTQIQSILWQHILFINLSKKHDCCLASP